LLLWRFRIMMVEPLAAEYMLSTRFPTEIFTFQPYEEIR
jgi:hypothetical protein